MNRGNFFRQGFIALLGLIFMLNASIARAEVYTGVGEYFMTDETVDFAKNKAEIIAERDILEQIKFYVKVNSKVVNSKLIEDEIITIASGILRVIDTKFSITAEDDVIKVKSLVTAQIDTDELEKLLEQAIKERVSDD